MSKYKQLYDGDCDEIELGRDERVACCDCGLVHNHHYQLFDRFTGKRIPASHVRLIVRRKRMPKETKKIRLGKA